MVFAGQDLMSVPLRALEGDFLLSESSWTLVTFNNSNFMYHYAAVGSLP